MSYCLSGMLYLSTSQSASFCMTQLKRTDTSIKANSSTAMDKKYNSE